VVVSSLRVTIPVARRLSRRRRTRQRPCILLQRKPSGFSRSVRLKATPYLPPLCVPHHDKHHSRITVLYERLRYRTLGIPARDTIHYHKVGNARVAGKHNATGPQAGGRLLRWRPNGGISKGRRPSRAEWCAGLGPPPAGVSPVFRAALVQTRKRRPFGRVIPHPGRRPSPCYPRSRRRAGLQLPLQAQARRRRDHDRNS
jgi:hypothetical protein